MWKLLLLLTSPKTWRFLLREDTWRQTRVSFRRAHKDARARKHIFGMTTLLLSPFLIAGYLALITQGFRGEYVASALVGLVISVVGIGVVSAYRWRRPVEKDGPVTLNLTGERTSPELSPLSIGETLFRELEDKALLAAVLSQRAGSERFLKTKVLPEGLEIVTRQKHLKLLRDRHLLDRLGEEEKALLFAADGHWDEMQIQSMTLQLEVLRVLRWLLRLENFLPVIGSQLLPTYELASKTLSSVDELYAAGSLVEMSNLRTAIEASEQYFYRCWAEGVNRGILDAETVESEQEARFYAGRLAGNENDDLLVGSKIVSELDDDVVIFTANMSLRRYRVLSWARDRMYGAAPFEDMLRCFH